VRNIPIGSRSMPRQKPKSSRPWPQDNCDTCLCPGSRSNLSCPNLEETFEAEPSAREHRCLT
jgi:hypothetical protein